MQEPTTRDQLVERIRADRAALSASFAGLPEAQLDTSGAAGYWSVKDILVHVAWWEQQTLAKLGGAATAHDQLGGADNDAQIERVNDAVYREGRARSAGEVTAAFADSGSGLLEALTGLEEHVVLANLDFIAENTYRHYPEHAAQISAWRSGVPAF
jgi:hypothetical protein